jgi:hypothetical protein
MSLAQELKTFECYRHNEKMKICIAADSATYDKVFGYSYRIFHISNPLDSSVIFRQVLNVNYALDFEYFLNKDFSDEFEKLIVLGVRSFYLYDLNKEYLTDQVLIDYTGCAFSDAQGSYIGDFKILEEGRVLQLQIKECGIRQYDIENIKEIKEIKSP